MYSAQTRSSGTFRQKQIPSSAPQGPGLGETDKKLRTENQFHKSLTVITLWLSALLAHAAQLHIGTAETIITPDRPIALEGHFRLRVSDGVSSPVMAQVVVLETMEGDKFQERSIMVSVDLVHLPWEMLHAVRARVKRALPVVDTSKIFISTTHTHQAPVVMRDNFIIPDGVMTVGEYIEFFAQQVSEAIVKACSNTRAGSMAWGLGNAEIGFNRRTAYLSGRGQMFGGMRTPDYKGPEGAVYRGMPILFFFDGDGHPIAAAVNPWCPAQVAPGDRRISADFWHPVREQLKKEFGEAFTLLCWCGAAGDQMPGTRLHPGAENRMLHLRGTGGWVNECARRIVASVLDVYRLVREERKGEIVLKHRCDQIRLPGWKLSDEEIADIRAAHDGFEEDLKNHPEKANALARPISWRAQTLEVQENLRKSKDGCYPSEIHVLRIGDVAVCTNQFELFTEYGLRMLARSDAQMTCVVQLAGPAYYLPTAEAIAGGGYSAIPETCPVGAEGGQVLVDETVKRITKLFNDLKVSLPEAGRLVDGKPVGKGWMNLLGSWEAWTGEADYWKLAEDGVLHGESKGGDYHFAWTKRRNYRDFELHAVVKMTGAGANSGVGIRLQPKSAQVAPGYQFDMGSGYWGCLWEEGGAGMVQEFPQRHGEQLVRHGDWNHWYIVAKGHQLQGWLNGVKTIDVVHKNGPLEGAIGFELCHGRKHTILEVRALAVRER